MIEEEFFIYACLHANKLLENNSGPLYVCFNFAEDCWLVYNKDEVVKNLDEISELHMFGSHVE